MADVEDRKPRETPERIPYRATLERLENFVDNEIVNLRTEDMQILNDLRGNLDAVYVEENYEKDERCGTETVGAEGGTTGTLKIVGELLSGQNATAISNIMQNKGTCINDSSKPISPITSECLRKIDEILEEDKKRMAPLEEWFKCT